MERIVACTLTGHIRAFMTGKDEPNICYKVRKKVEKELDEGRINRLFQDDFSIHIDNIEPIKQKKRWWYGWSKNKDGFNFAWGNDQ